MNYSQRLYRDKIVTNIEPYILENVQYETIMGSQAYGVSNDDSDLDIYAFTIPPKRIVFPHTAGYIYNFGKKGPETFKQYQKHHINAYDKEIDLNIFSIVTYFTLLMDNNPNMLDSLFTRQQSVTHSTKIGDMVKDSRHMFLHKGAWHRYRGYAYAQMKKLRHKESKGMRKELVEKYGYDVKFGYHIIRLINQVEDILVHGDFDPMAHREMLKSVRRGDWSIEEIEDFFKRKEKTLDELYAKSTLQHTADEAKIKQLLLDCLEEFYGTVSADDVRSVDKFEQALQEIKQITNRVIK